MTSPTPTPSRTRHRSLESHVLGNGSAWFGGGGKGVSTWKPPRRAAYPVIRLPRIGGFAADGSYLARLSGGSTSLTMRVIEYLLTLDGQTTPELFCLVTDLLDHQAHPAHPLADAYRWRWDGSETALREAKSTIHDACGVPKVGPARELR